MCQFLELLSITFDVIVLSEIWTNNITFYSNILPGYTVYYDLPYSSHVGGVGIYVSNSWSRYQINEFKLATTQSDVENIWIEIRKFNRTFIVGGIYRHHNKSVS